MHAWRWWWRRRRRRGRRRWWWWHAAPFLFVLDEPAIPTQTISSCTRRAAKVEVEGIVQIYCFGGLRQRREGGEHSIAIVSGPLFLLSKVIKCNRKSQTSAFK